MVACGFILSQWDLFGRGGTDALGRRRLRLSVAAAICRHMAPDRRRYAARFSFMAVSHPWDAY